MKKQTYKIHGMHCASCVATIERALSKTAGVHSTSVNFASESVLIEFDEKIISPSNLAKIVNETGYHLEINSQTEKEKPAMGSHEHNHAEMERGEQIKEMKRKLIIGGILSLFIFLGSFPEWFSFVPKILNNNWALLLLTTPVQFWVGWQFYSGLKLLIKYRMADMNTLIAIGTLAAYFYSAAVTVFPVFFTKGGITPAIYFDTSAIIIVLILLGKYFEVLMKGRASEAIKKLIGLQPKTAKILRDGKEVEMPIADVIVGDLIIVRPGERIPVDGKITEGDSEIDESMVTGESMPVHKKVGSAVIGSTINKFGTFTFQATKVGKDTVLSRIIKMVEEAQGSKAPIQRLADLVSSYFVPIVIMLAIATFVVWYNLGPEPALLYAILNTVAVLIIACPCAMGLATPTAIMVGTGKGAEHGILIKDAESLEIAHKVKTIIFDKTGTLTKGEPSVTDVIAFDNGKENEVLRYAASLEKFSEHPVAMAIVAFAASLGKSSSHPLDKAIREKAETEKTELFAVDKFKANTGKGLEGEIIIVGSPKKFYFGNRALMKDISIDLGAHEIEIEKLENEGKTVMILASDSDLLGAIAVADTVKENARQGIEELKKLGIEPVMITGDNFKTAMAIANKVGITRVLAEVLPDQKEAEVKKIQAENKIVAMVGDGINDAPALAQADVGIAMGTGTDVAIEAADITLINKDLKSVAATIRLSKMTMKTIKLNLFWAFGYNIILIPVAMGALYPSFHILLNPIFASIAMATSSISVVSSSLLLKRFRLNGTQTKSLV